MNLEQYKELESDITENIEEFNSRLNSIEEDYNRLEQHFDYEKEIKDKLKRFEQLEINIDYVIEIRNIISSYVETNKNILSDIKEQVLDIQKYMNIKKTINLRDNNLNQLEYLVNKLTNTLEKIK
jgi:archaellum component FlaC